MNINAFFDDETFTLTYVVWDPRGRDAVIIDPVLNYDPLSSQTNTQSVDEILAFVARCDLRVHWILETHAHADHLSGAQLLKHRLQAKTAIGEHIREVQKVFGPLFDFPETFATDGSQFDRLLRDGEVLQAGAVRIEVMHTPGHTPACCVYQIDDAIFSGDVLFMDDYGTGRCDFPKGSAKDMYHSVHERLYRLPDETRVFVGHDYQPGGRALRYETTIGASKRNNPQLNQATSEEAFIAFREQRDASLKPPRLIYQSIQVNIAAGRLPEKHGNGKRYLLMPLNHAHPSDDRGQPEKR